LAKGQSRGNREAKKPKTVKVKPLAAASPAGGLATKEQPGPGTKARRQR